MRLLVVLWNAKIKSLFGKKQIRGEKSLQNRALTYALLLLGLCWLRFTDTFGTRRRFSYTLAHNLPYTTTQKYNT